jgi:hypothetical protein
LFAIIHLSSKASTLEHTQLFGLLAEISLKLLSQVNFLGIPAKALAIQAISCLKTGVSSLYQSGFEVLSTMICLEAKKFAASNSSGLYQ